MSGGAGQLTKLEICGFEQGAHIFKKSDCTWSTCFGISLIKSPAPNSNGTTRALSIDSLISELKPGRGFRQFDVMHTESPLTTR